MTLFDPILDTSIVLVYIAGTVMAGLMVRKYVLNVDDFLLAGRSVNLYLGIASLSATEFGIATCMANAELGFKYGFAGITPGIALAAAMMIVGLTGFCINPLRKMGVVTVPELFEQKFGSKVRWASGLVILLGGLLNMGVFLRQAGNFLTTVCGFPPGFLEIVMTILLVCVALYTILGGMLSVIITDYIQFVIMSLGLITVVLLFFFQTGWESMTQAVETHIGEAGFNPLHGNNYPIDRIILDVLIGFSAVLTWQTMISRVLSSKDAETGRKMYVGTSPFFLVRFTVPVLLGVFALHYFGDEVGEGFLAIDAMPHLIATMVPIGLIGILVAAMLAADMSTNSSYLLAWSSVIYNDLMKPWHKNEWSNQKSLYWNRILIVFIGLFLLVYGLWYPMKGDLWVYMQVTGTIYLSSMSVLLIASCYWPAANNWGAIAAIATGSIIPVTFLVMEQLPTTQEWIASVGVYKTGIFTFAITGVAMVLGSVIKNKLKR